MNCTKSTNYTEWKKILREYMYWPKRKLRDSLLLLTEQLTVQYTLSSFVSWPLHLLKACVMLTIGSLRSTYFPQLKAIFRLNYSRNCFLTFFPYPVQADLGMHSELNNYSDKQFFHILVCVHLFYSMFIYHHLM